MTRGANYLIVEEDFLGKRPLVLKDVGPHDRHRTVTNDIENVVRELSVSGRLRPGQRLLYRDSAGELTEALHQGGRFTEFAVPFEAGVDAHEIGGEA